MYGCRGLLLAGLAFPELRESGRWVRRALRLLLEHGSRDVYPDGCHKERAPHYHLGVAGSFMSAFELLEGAPTLATSRARLGKTARSMLRWTATVMAPSRHSPTVGDSEYDVPREQFLRAGVRLRDPFLVWASGASAKEIAVAGRDLPAGKPIRPRPQSTGGADLTDSGFLVVRSGWRGDDLWFLANYGPYAGGHSHAEALAFQLWSGGAPLAADCGRGVNYDDPLHRGWYVTPYAHNMVVVDGAAPSARGRKGKLLFHSRLAGAQLFGLEHTGYAELGVRHRRCFLVNTQERYLVVLDFLRSGGPTHRFEWVLNTPVEGVREKRGAIIGRGLTVLSADPSLIEGIEVAPARMCLPLEGRTTWGVERGSGTNVRFSAHGSSMGLHFLLAPSEAPAAVRFHVERRDKRSPYRLRVGATVSGVERIYDVDCAGGSIAPAR